MCHEQNVHVSLVARHLQWTDAPPTPRRTDTNTHTHTDNHTTTHQTTQTHHTTREPTPTLPGGTRRAHELEAKVFTRKGFFEWKKVFFSRWVQKKRFQYCLSPNSSKHFLHFRAIQEHSGGTLVDPTLQDYVLLPDDFAEYTHHTENAHDMHSIIEGALIPGGISL